MRPQFLLDTNFIIVMVQNNYLKAKNVEKYDIFRCPKPFQFSNINQGGWKIEIRGNYYFLFPSTQTRQQKHLSEYGTRILYIELTFEINFGHFLTCDQCCNDRLYSLAVLCPLTLVETSATNSMWHSKQRLKETV